MYFNFYRDMILMCLHIYRTITIQEEKNMGGFFGVASKEDCVFDLFFGTDYHSHLGTRRAGLAVYERDVGLTVPSTILKMHLSVPNLTKRSRK